MADLSWTQLHFPARTPYPLIPLFFKKLSIFFLKIFNEGASIASLGKEFHRFTTLWVKKFLLSSVLNLLPLILRLCPLVLLSPHQWKQPACVYPIYSLHNFICFYKIPLHPSEFQRVQSQSTQPLVIIQSPQLWDQPSESPLHSLQCQYVLSPHNILVSSVFTSVLVYSKLTKKMYLQKRNLPVNQFHTLFKIKFIICHK